MRIRYDPSRQSTAAGLLAVAVLGFGSIGINLYQRAHGFTDPLFFILGCIMLAAGVPLYVVSWRKPPPLRSIRIWVLLTAGVLSLIAMWPSINIAIRFADFQNSYLAVRAWLFAGVGVCGLFLLVIFGMASLRVQRL